MSEKQYPRRIPLIFPSSLLGTDCSLVRPTFRRVADTIWPTRTISSNRKFLSSTPTKYWTKLRQNSFPTTTNLLYCFPAIFAIVLRFVFVSIKGKRRSRPRAEKTWKSEITSTWTTHENVGNNQYSYRNRIPLPEFTLVNSQHAWCINR